MCRLVQFGRVKARNAYPTSHRCRVCPDQHSDNAMFFDRDDWRTGLAGSRLCIDYPMFRENILARQQDFGSQMGSMDREDSASFNGMRVSKNSKITTYINIIKTSQ